MQDEFIVTSIWPYITDLDDIYIPVDHDKAARDFAVRYNKDLPMAPGATHS
jgi:hypothetical protein